MEQQLLADLGVGRTPLREAIQRLVQYGLIIAPPRQSAIVAPIQAFEIAEIVEVREILERSAARLAATRATPKDVRALRDASDHFDDCMELKETRRIVLADAAFHDTLAAAAHNQHLRQSIAWNRDYGGRLWFLSVSRGGPMPSSDYSHAPIVEAVKAKDPDAAEKAIAFHIELFRTRLQRMITEVRPGGMPI
jgi:DNA-binding GntR family transcriptional regulator